MSLPWRSWLRTLAKLAAVCVVLALVGELVLRLFGYGSYIIYTPDEELLWHPEPNQKGRTVAGRQPFTINEEGLRYKVAMGPPDADEVRIYSFGDSVTMGWGMSDDQHYSAFLEQQLNAQAGEPRFRAASAGVNAYPTGLCARRFARLLREGHQIDVAILAYSFNRGFESLLALEGQEKHDFLGKVRLKSWVRRVALYNFLIEDVLRTAVYYRLRSKLLAGSWEVKGQRGERSPEETRQPLAEMLRITEEHDVGLVFLLLGSEDQREERNPNQIAFQQFAEDEGVPLVDMVSHFATIADHGHLFIDHTHPSAKGHEMIAVQLAPVVSEIVASRRRADVTLLADHLEPPTIVPGESSR